MELQRLPLVLGAVLALSAGCTLNQSILKRIEPRNPDAATLIVQNKAYAPIRVYLCVDWGCQTSSSSGLVFWESPFVHQTRLRPEPAVGYYLGQVAGIGLKETFAIPSQFIGNSNVPQLFLAMSQSGEYYLSVEIPVANGDTLEVTVEYPLNGTTWLTKHGKSK